MAETPTPETPTPPAKKGVSWTKILLVGSLSLNLLIAGLVAGAIMSERPKDGNPLLRALGYGPFVQALPRQDKVEMTRAMKAQAGSFRENRRALRREFERFLEILRSDPFEVAELTAAIERQRGRISERQALGSALLIERITAMSPADRVAYADKLEALLRRHGPGPKADD